MTPTGPRLETERLLLRWFTVDDIDAFNELGTNPQIIRYVGNRPFASSFDRKIAVADLPGEQFDLYAKQLGQ